MKRAESFGKKLDHELVRENLMDYCSEIAAKRDKKNADEEKKDKMVRNLKQTPSWQRCELKYQKFLIYGPHKMNIP